MSWNKIWTLALVGAVFGCQTSVVPVSSRTVAGMEKEGSNMGVYGRSPNDPVKPPELFVRKKNLSIAPLKQENTTGSLFNLDDERNYLFAARGPTAEGKYLTIEVASTRADKAAETKAGDKAKTDDKPKSEVEAAILKSLPELAPADNGPSLLKRIQMRVVQRFENGDVLVMTQRASNRGPMGNEIDASARIPYEKLISGGSLTTEDLLDVHWTESEDGQIVERYSTGWEDEYTARLSGFNEAKSRLAADLDDKRRQILDARTKIIAQAKSIGEERGKLARERDALAKRQATDAEKMQLLEKTVSDQSDKIKDLTPPEDTSASADASGDPAAKPTPQPKASAKQKAKKP